MSSLNELNLESNNKIKINFNGGDLSSDAGLIPVNEFARKIGFNNGYHPLLAYDGLTGDLLKAELRP